MLSPFHQINVLCVDILQTGGGLSIFFNVNLMLSNYYLEYLL